jgi:hypothetical protein
MDWARVCVDVDDRGNVRGYSVEVHDDRELVTLKVWPCGPFDTPAEVLAEALAWLSSTYGTQLTLSLF